MFRECIFLLSASAVCKVFSYFLLFLFFFFNDTAPTEIYTLSLHDALPISHRLSLISGGWEWGVGPTIDPTPSLQPRSEEHTSELQSHSDLVCRLLLEKKNKDFISSTLKSPHSLNITPNKNTLRYYFSIARH